ncbi:10679_t:CDS:2, partial [Acaulospora morrowiae]
ENEIVEKEFKLLNDDSNIYKLIGPVLVKQEKSEATLNVSKRLEYIRSEMFVSFLLSLYCCGDKLTTRDLTKRVESQIKDLTEKLEKKKLEVVEIQGQYSLSLQKSEAATQ